MKDVAEFFMDYINSDVSKLRLYVIINVTLDAGSRDYRNKLAHNS